MIFNDRLTSLLILALCPLIVLAQPMRPVETNSKNTEFNQAGGVLKAEPIAYPYKAQMSGVEGEVQLRFDINADGTMQAVEVIFAKPSRVFDDSILEDVKNWTFKQKRVNGRAMAYQFDKTIEFKLKNYETRQVYASNLKQ